MVNIFSNNLNFKNKKVNYPCISLGEKIYVPRTDGKIDEEEITRVEYVNDHWCISSLTRRHLYERDIGTKVFKTEQEASDYIKIQKLKKIKRQRMKEFEKTINKELGLNTWIIR